MIRTFVEVLLVVLVVILCPKYGQTTEQQNPNSTPDRILADLTATERKLVKSSNRFGLKLFREIASRGEPDLNVLVSPMSASYALAITYNGAAGETREAIARTLEIVGLSVGEINESYQSLIEILIQGDPMVDFKNANSIWYRLGKPIQSSFVDLCSTYFDARVQEIDLRAPWAVDTINNWVNLKTNGKISEIVKHPLPPKTAMILLNAVYFKGSWTFPFDTARTRTLPFHLADGSQTDCEMMFLREKDHAFQIYNTLMPDSNATYFRNELFQAVSLPYGQEGFRMIVMVPDSSLTVDSIINKLTVENWSDWSSGFYPEKFILGLPKFKFDYAVDMNEMLKALGMEIAFDPGRCDLSNMFADSVGWVDEVKQKTFIQVDEEGTEVAAVTQIRFAESLPPFVLADRPFLFVIHEEESEVILFIGKVANTVWID